MIGHIEHRHAITVPLPPENAFPLFTPAGEKLWLPEWVPEFIHPIDGRTEVGMVFRTSHGGEETLWSCIEFLPEQRRIRYVRVSPDTRFVTLAIRCTHAAGNGTIVDIRYDITALTPAGTRMLETLTPGEFATSIDTWQEKIVRYTKTLQAGMPVLDKYSHVQVDTPCNGGAASVSPGA